MKQQLRWFGHVVRIPKDCTPRQVLYVELRNSKRSTGGQRKSYKDDMKRTKKRFHLDLLTTESNSGDMCVWRQQVAAAAAVIAADFSAATAHYASES